MSSARTLLCEHNRKTTIRGGVLRSREYEDGAWDLSIAINDRKAIKSATTLAGNSAGKFGVFGAALLATGCGPSIAV